MVSLPCLDCKIFYADGNQFPNLSKGTALEAPLLAYLYQSWKCQAVKITAHTDALNHGF